MCLIFLCGVSLIHMEIEVQLLYVAGVLGKIDDYLHTTNGESSFCLAPSKDIT